LKTFIQSDNNPKPLKFVRDGRAPIPQKESISKLMSANKGKNTKPEIAFRKALWNRGITGYRLHWKKVPGRPDIAFPGKRVAIFINGCFWHRCPYCQPPTPKSHSEFWKDKFSKNILRDNKKIDLLIRDEWKVLIVWECQIKNKITKIINETIKLLEKNDD
jgi:DNA mismatch endonuclease (patch repair protein)